MAGLLSHRRQLLGIAKTWALAKLPGWSDETHRDLLARHLGYKAWLRVRRVPRKTELTRLELKQ